MLKKSIYLFFLFFNNGARAGFSEKQQPQQQRTASPNSTFPKRSIKIEQLSAQGSTHLTAEERKQLLLLEQKDNDARAVSIIEFLLNNPSDLSGTEALLGGIDYYKREKILILVESIVRERKLVLQRACMDFLSEDAFKKIRMLYASYEQIEEFLRIKRRALLDGFSSYEKLEVYLHGFGFDPVSAGKYAACVIGGFLIRGLFK